MPIALQRAAPPPLRESPRLRELSRDVTSKVFWGTLMAQVRNAREKGGIMSGGRAEEIFGQQLDNAYVEKLSARQHGGLAEQVYRHLLRQQNRVQGSTESQ